MGYNERDILRGIGEDERETLWTDEDVAEQDELERQADALLIGARAACSRRSKVTGIYTEKRLRRHAEREMSNVDETLLMLEIADCDLSDMLEADIARAAKKAGLSDVEEAAWGYYIAAIDAEEIARLMGKGVSTVHAIIARSRCKIETVLLGDPYYGLSKVYWDEVHRGK
jgi:hypothetical protein